VADRRDAGGGTAAPIPVSSYRRDEGSEGSRD
jgi:hypothetical protein